MRRANVLDLLHQQASARGQLAAPQFYDGLGALQVGQLEAAEYQVVRAPMGRGRW